MYYFNMLNEPTNHLDLNAIIWLDKKSFIFGWGEGVQCITLIC